MSLKQRLRQLEKRLPAPQELVPWIAVVDDDDLVLDDGSPAIARWAGKPSTSLPAGVQVIRGINLRLVVGPA